jgi:branched-chain amino acid transport system substrate-binding protein
MAKRERKSKLAIAILSVAVLSMIFCGCIGQEPEEAPEEEMKEPIKIGFSHPFSGPASELGATVKRGIDLAIEEINESGGILGRPLKIFLADDRCDPTEAPKAIQKLITVDQVDFILGPQCSSAVLAILPIVNEEQIPMLVYAATSPKITEQIGDGGFEWIFRINPMDAAMGPPFADYAMTELGVESISILALNNDWGRGNVDVWQGLSEELGFEIKSVDYFQYGDTEFTPILTKIKDVDADGIFLIADYQEGYNVMKQYHELGMDQLVLGRGGVATKHFFEIAGEELADGIYGINFYTIKLDTPEHDAFVERFKERSGYLPDIGGAWGYTAVYVLKAAIEKAGTTDQAAVRDALEDVTLDNFLGHIEFDDHNQSWSPVWIQQLKDGDEILIAEVPTLPYKEIFYASLEE